MWMSEYEKQELTVTFIFQKFLYVILGRAHICVYYIWKKSALYSKASRPKAGAFSLLLQFCYLQSFPKCLGTRNWNSCGFSREQKVCKLFTKKSNFVICRTRPFRNNWQFWPEKFFFGLDFLKISRLSLVKNSLHFHFLLSTLFYPIWSIIN